ncbi:dihydrolipoyl dehydrogenase [Zobellella sp. DQSA1]|uniref:dihydrolipoyl dehydrogenase n=1 Tax=Zobellella sp. DQSA1 TaxID=3342386 RepID=UPI0035C188E3
MKHITADVAIIGSGTAGLAAYRTARAHHKKVIMIEGGRYGTTCARVGCMPSKLLIAAADSAHRVAQAPAFGVHPGGIRIDGRQVMSRVKAERDRFVGLVLASVDSIPAEDKMVGRARFVDKNTLMVDGHTRITATSLVIATGSRPSFPDAWRELGALLQVNDDVFEWDLLPRSVAVFGPGVIGLELGQALHRLGVKVWMFGVGGQLAGLTDPAVMACAGKGFAEEFFLDADARVGRMERIADGVEIDYLDAEGVNERIQVDLVIAATGRRPNVDRLGLERLGMALDDKGVPLVDPYTLQTSLPHIFVAGDANDQLPLLHEANTQGRIAGDNAGRFPDIRAGLRHSRLAVVFTDPQIAMVGAGYRELERRYGGDGCFAIGEASFEDQGRSRVVLRNRGMVRLYAEQGSGLFLGAEMSAPEAEHLAHLLAWAHQSRMTVAQMLEMPFFHPVIEEGVRTALRDLNAGLHRGPAMADRCMECGVGD